MRGNLHKSDAGWVRLRARVNARGGVRAAQMDHRAKPGRLTVKTDKVETQPGEVEPDFIMRKGRKRRRVTAPEGKFF